MEVGGTVKRYFNSQPHEEADGADKGAFVCGCYFNSQPHEEADFSSVGILNLTTIFQLTASRRG